MSSSSGETESRRAREKIIFGTAALGLAYGLPRPQADAATMLSDEDVELLVEHALEVGIDTFDTAPAYGTSEARLGGALRGRGRIWTKVLAGDPAVSVDASLERLGHRSHVELLQWHNWSAGLARDEAWRKSWLSLRGDPRVRSLGATTYGKVDALAAVESGLFDVVQVEFNLLNQGVVDLLAARSKSHGAAVRVSVRSVFLQGALTDEGRALPADRPVLADAIRRARDVATVAGGGLTHLALRAAVDHAAIDHVVLGFDRPPQIDAALALLDQPLPDAARAAIGSLDLGGDPSADPRFWNKS